MLERCISPLSDPERETGHMSLQKNDVLVESCVLDHHGSLLL